MDQAVQIGEILAKKELAGCTVVGRSRSPDEPQEPATQMLPASPGEARYSRRAKKVDVSLEPSELSLARRPTNKLGAVACNAPGVVGKPFPVCPVNSTLPDASSAMD